MKGMGAALLKQAALGKKRPVDPEPAPELHAQVIVEGNTYFAEMIGEDTPQNRRQLAEELEVKVYALYHKAYTVDSDEDGMGEWFLHLERRDGTEVMEEYIDFEEVREG